MSLAARQAASFGRLAQRFGQGAEATVRRASTLKNESTGTLVTTLAVNGTTAAGASSINLDAASVAGVLVKGATFTIAGDGTTYTVGANVTAASNALASVAISPVLAAEAADDAAVTVTQSYGEMTYPASRANFESALVDGEAIEHDDWKLLIATTDEITEKSVVQFDGEKVNIVSVLTAEPGEQRSGSVVHCRG